MLRFIKFIFFILFLSCIPLFSGTKGLSKGQVLSVERYFDWDGSTSAWVTTQRDVYELDSLGMIIRKVVYNGSGSIIRVWNCSYTDTTYSLYYNDNGWDGYKMWWSSYTEYKYNLDGTILSYTYNYDWTDPIGGGWYDNIITYNYINNKLSQIDEVFNEMGFGSYHYLTTFSYDTEGKILSELKQSYFDEHWVDKERTLWTWDGNNGTGINEIYKNTVWIHKGLKERTVDSNVKTTSEYRDYWSWGFWINDVHERDYYNTYGNITTIFTDKFNTTTSLYENDKLHAFYYEYFEGLTAPLNITSVTSGSSITLSWDEVNGATGYKIYSSSDPYGEFSFDTSGTFNGTEWTAPVSENKKFYQVTAINGEK